MKLSRTGVRASCLVVSVGVASLLIAGCAQPRVVGPDRAPEFSATTSAGESIGLADFDGKVVLVDFWAHWCPPCRASRPYMAQVEERFEGDGRVAFLNVHTDDSNEARTRAAFVDQGRAGVLIPQGEALAGTFGVRGQPAYLVIDAEGDVVFAQAGFEPGDEGVIAAAIEEALGD